MAKAPRFAKDIARIERSAFNLSIGARAAIFVVAPMLVAIAIHQPYLLFTTLGAALLVLTEGQPSILSGRTLIVACLTEGTGVGLGTLAATTGPLLSISLIGIATFVALIAHGSPKWASLGTYTAITFALGVGLPGSSLEAAGFRAFFLLLGGLWALLGVELHRFVARLTKSAEATGRSFEHPMPRSETFKSAFIIAVACALGFALAFALGFPRDYWVVITIISTVRPSISMTTTFTSMMAMGTVIGASIGVIALAIGNVYLLSILLFVVAVLMFSLRGVNFALVQVFATSFIIILLNIAFPGEWYLALYRIIDVCIGVAVALILVELLGIFMKESSWL